jgi:hypothetical protein
MERRRRRRRRRRRERERRRRTIHPWRCQMSTHPVSMGVAECRR